MQQPRWRLPKGPAGTKKTSNAVHFLTSKSGVESLSDLVPSRVLVHDAAELLASSGTHQPGAEIDVATAPDDILFYQLTSGSTGTPKCIPEWHAAVISHIRHSAAHCGLASTDVTLNWLPFDHVVPMLTFHLCDVYLQRHALQLPTAEVIAEPLKWVDVMASWGVTHSWAPIFGFKLVVQAASTATVTDVRPPSAQPQRCAGASSLRWAAARAHRRARHQAWSSAPRASAALGRGGRRKTRSFPPPPKNLAPARVSTNSF